jgi:hypothetical protein
MTRQEREAFLTCVKAAPESEEFREITKGAENFLKDPGRKWSASRECVWAYLLTRDRKYLDALAADLRASADRWLTIAEQLAERKKQVPDLTDGWLFKPDPGDVGQREGWD